MSENRPKCSCGKLRAKNYINEKTGKQYYRKKCHSCLSKEKQAGTEWENNGYIKSQVCEKCGFRSKYNDQIVVIQTKGTLLQYKSICLNCAVILEKDNSWSTGDLTPDF